MATFQLPDRVECYRHADQLTGVYCTRCGRPVCPDCLPAVPAVQHCPSCVTEAAAGAPAPPGRRPWGRLTRLRPVVAGLIAVNIAAFVLTSVHRTWELDFAQIPPFIAGGQVYRLITAAFVHENLAHLLFNMAALYVTGPPVEEAMGPRRFLGLYLLAALGGSVCSFVLGPVFVAGLGASGAIFGLFGAWFALARAQRSQTAVIVLVIAIMLAYSFYDTGIDWRAHVGGLATGVVVGAVYARAARQPPRVRVMYEAAVAVALVALFAALVVVRSARIVAV